MQIAIIGFRRVYEFTCWCKNNHFKRVSEKIYQSPNDTIFGIFEERDLIGRLFDEYIEIDYLKEDLKRRIRNK